MASFKRIVVALALVVLAGCTTTPPATQGATSSSSSATTTLPSVSPSPSVGEHHRSRLPRGTVTSVLMLPSSPLALVAGDGALFTIVKTPGAEGSTPYRLDPPSSVTRGSPVVLGRQPLTMLTFAGGAPWLASRSGEIARLDPSSLVPTFTLHAPGRIVDIASSPGRLWVVSSRTIEAVDPIDGRVITSFPEGAGITRFAVSLNGRQLYVALAGPVRHDEPPLVELDAKTGSVLARTRVGYADLGGLSGLTPTPTGVWATAPSGMMGASVFARVSDLRLHDGEVSEHGGPIPGFNGMKIYLAGGLLWETTGDGGLYCLDAVSAKTEGLIVPRGRLGLGGVVTDEHQLWTTARDSIDRLTPPTSCTA